MKTAYQPGQVLILVLLVVVVSLTIGLSVASRNITNLRTATQTEQSQRAFSAAEAGIEHVLAKGDPASFNEKSIDVNGITANLVVTAKTVYTRTIDVGDIGQIDLSHASGSLVRIEWEKTGTSEENNIADLELVEVYGSGSYSQNRVALKGSDRSGESGFVNPSGCTPSADYKKCHLYTFHANSQILRIRPFWSKASVQVSPGGNNSIGTQSYDITSVASTDNGVTRKVQVNKTLPQLPAVFDYALYSDTGISK